MIIKPNEQLGKQTIGNLISLTSLNKDIVKHKKGELETDKEKNKRTREEVLKEVFE